MGHKFDVKNSRKSDSEKRRRMLPPYETLVMAGLKEGDIMADIGCGIGYFTFPAAEIVGPGGQIYAMDISLEMLKEVEKKMSEKATLNISTIKTEENNLKINDETVTVAFISNVLHEAEDIEIFLSEVKRVIKNNGKVAVVEWQKIESDFGPPLDHRLDKQYVQKLLEGVGFKKIQITDIGEHFYTVSGQK